MLIRWDPIWQYKGIKHWYVQGGWTLKTLRWVKKARRKRPRTERVRLREMSRKGKSIDKSSRSEAAWGCVGIGIRHRRTRGILAGWQDPCGAAESSSKTRLWSLPAQLKTQWTARFKWVHSQQVNYTSIKLLKNNNLSVWWVRALLLGRRPV